MIATWILYATLVSALFAVAAAALERTSHLWHRPGRWSWMLALTLSITVPAAVALAPRTPEPAIALRLTAAGRRAAASAVVAAAPRSTFPLASLASLDGPLAALWSLLSLGVLIAFARSALAVRRARRAWRVAEVRGTAILLAPNVGPAVVGFTRPEIVVPEWALGINPALLDLMLRHELEHVRARDPLTLLLAAAALILAPWNLALWWQVRRLRLAVELDCDRRVLAAGARLGAPVVAREYAALLVAVGERATATSPAPVWSPAFSEFPSFLERRIVAMSDVSSRHRAAQAAGLAAVVAILVAVACEAPRPDPLAPQQGRTSEAPILALKQSAETDEAGVRVMVSEHFPEVLRGDTNPRPMIFILNSERTVLATARGASVANSRYRTLPDSIRYKRMSNQSAGDSSGTYTVRLREEQLDKRRDEAAASLPRKSAGVVAGEVDPLNGLINPSDIQSVDVRKFRAGTLSTVAAAAIVVVLKPGATLK
ncbi:MAG: M56 family metallopeptidase [Gemmatimonadaceae bacterium]